MLCRLQEIEYPVKKLECVFHVRTNIQKIKNPKSTAFAILNNIIKTDNKGLKPINNKNVAKRLKKALREVLKKFEEEIKTLDNAKAIIVIEKKINNINSPTTRDKLIEPFEIYDIKLSSEEERAIRSRNTFLHGSNIKLEKENSKDMETYKISLRLNKLLNKVILKHIGYQGYIINHLKHSEDDFREIINEELFKKI